MENQNNLQLLTTKNFNGVQLDCYQAENDSSDFWATREQIGRLLEYENPSDAIRLIHKRNKERLDKFSLGVQIERGIKGVRTATVYNFRGLLEICRWSNQPKANAVMDFLWEVADDIRQYGMYMSNKAIDELVKGSEQFQALLGNYVAEKTRNKALTEKLKEFSPYVAIGKAVSACQDSITFGEAACLLQQHGLYEGGRNTMMKDFRDRGLLCAQKSRWNKPSQKGIISGIVCLTLVDDDGNPLHYSRTKVTMDGLAKLAKEKFDDRFPLLKLIYDTEKEITEAISH